MSAISPLDLNGPLAQGTLVLEASAGTGKTYALSHRVLREVGEQGRQIDQILVVTFTRAAAAEIRRRIRLRLEEAATALAYRLAGQDTPLSDATLAELIERWSSADNNLKILLNLLRAIDRIDLAPITTIHGFIQRLISDNAALLGLDPQLRLQESNGALLLELVNDWRRSRLSPATARWQAWVQSHSDLTAEALLELARLVDDDRDMLLPTAEASQPEAAAQWHSLETRFLEQLSSHGAETAEALKRLCRGKDNSSPAGRRLGKTKLEQLPELIAAAGEQLSHNPQASTAREYRQLIQAFSTSQLRKVLADPDQAPSSGLHGAAEQLCFEPIETLMLELVQQLRQQAWQQRSRRHELSFGDLLERVDPNRLEPEVLAGLKLWRQREFSCCLIDEFQDTDPIQWRLFAALFDADAPLVLIGDPKQAIYRFRGGDIRTYRSATADPQRQRFSLDTNRRSDPALLQVLNGLFSGDSCFGSSAIRYREVLPPEGANSSRLRLADGQPAPPVRLRWLGEEADGKPLNRTALRQGLAQRVCDDLQRTLAAGLEVQEQGDWRPLHPGDLAVLVGRNRDAVELQRELQRRGIPARIGRGGNLWQSPETASLGLLLECLEREGDRSAAAALALSSVGGWLALELQQWQADDWGQWLQLLQQARQRWQRVGPLAALEVVQEQGQAMARLLGQLGGEQRLSDRRQIGELLQQSWQEQGRPTAARLLHWLTQQQLLGGEGEEAQQRIVASEAMVTLTTLHASKGLEFPLVWCPTLWECDPGPSAEAPFRAWDPELGRRVLELSRRDHSSPRLERLQEARLEGWQERLRLGYVALTRAKHQLCIDWGRIKDSGASLPAWLLHPEQRRANAEPPWQELSQLISAAPDLKQQVQRRCAALGVHFEELNNQAPRPYQAPSSSAPAALASPIPAARPTSHWGRWSYSRLQDQGDTLPSAREEEGFDPDRGGDADDPGSSEHPSWRELPGGASFGTLVHAVLEKLDFNSDLDGDDARRLIRDEVARSGLDTSLNERLPEALKVLLQRPLGGPLGELQLAEIARSDTLRELPFDMPLSGFAAGPACDVLGEALQQLSRHPDATVQRYAKERLQQRQVQLSSGFLNGVIDLIVRRPQLDAQGRQHWVVLDWKTNRLVKPIEQLMASKDYWLQAQLYRQAVRRWLQLRLGEDTPMRVDAVMLFTRSGAGAWLLQPELEP
ncbi:MAG: UvrD-helicase domain-containing protein [Synechococcus sp.]|nr:UvrD-helicase domain-containing protein [Synechococcus sp.]